MRGSSANSVSRVARPFFWGRNPSKQNFSFGNPDATNAGTKAVAGQAFNGDTSSSALSYQKEPGVGDGRSTGIRNKSYVFSSFYPSDDSFDGLMLVEFMVGLHASVYIEVFQ